MATSDHTIRLQPTTYDALEAEAARRHVAPDDLADEMMRERLTAGAHREEGGMRATLERLRQISARMPEIDAARLVREGRDELDRRGTEWLPS